MLVSASVVISTGCVSRTKYRSLDAANRQLRADNEAVSQDLLDERQVNDNLRVRVRSLENDMGTKSELVDQYRKENELLDGIRRKTESELEDLANARPGDIVIAAPMLPEPLDSAIKRFAEAYPNEVSYDRSAGTVKWKADLLFALGSDVVKDSSMEALRAFTEIVNSSAAQDFELFIVGHTDNRPISRPETRAKHATNWHLSAHRAIAVGEALQRYGYAPGRIAVAGCGEYRPVADNSGEAGSSQNRRVEVYLVPAGSVLHANAGRTRPGPKTALAGNEP